MTVTARLFGTLRRFSSEGSPGIWQGDLPVGSTIQDVVRALGAEEREVSLVTVNGTVMPMDSEVPPEANLVLVTVMGGG